MKGAAAVLAVILTLIPSAAEDPRRREDPRALAAAAASLMSRARQTGDAGLYARAERTCDQALALAPGLYDALRVRAWIYGGQHRFVEAAGAARRAMALRPADPFNYGTLGDALVETGDYRGAEEAFQTMIDLRPDEASYARGAYLRELYGDTAGAIELMSMASASASPADSAWYRAQLGDLRFSQGDLRGAVAEHEAALATAPASHAALAGLARAKAALGASDEAVTLYRRSLELLPAPHVAVELGELLASLGRDAEAKRAFDLLEATIRLGLFDRQIAVIHADRGIDVDGAHEVAERSLVIRKDIYGYDAAAWCALKAGRTGRAREAIREALRLGTRDARLLYHAGMIAAAAGEKSEAMRYLSDALRINPWFGVRDAKLAREALRELS